MLARQLDGPDLDGLISEAAFFLGLEVHHTPLGLWVVVEERVSACGGHSHDGAVEDFGVAEDEVGCMLAESRYASEGHQQTVQEAAHRFHGDAAFFTRQLRSCLLQSFANDPCIFQANLQGKWLITSLSNHQAFVG